MTGWSLVYTDYVPAQQKLREALCTLGNGYFATRGAACSAAADANHYPGTYVAGCYNRLTDRIRGHAIENESMVNVPNWLPLTMRIDGGEWFHPGSVEILSYHQELVMRAGELLSRIRFRDPTGRTTTLEERRLVHMANPHCGALQILIRPENWSGEVEIRSGIDGDVTNAGVARYRDLDGRHLGAVSCRAVDDEVLSLTARTSGSGIEIAEATRTRIYLSGELVRAPRRLETTPRGIAQHVLVNVPAGSELIVEKLLAIHTSRDFAIYQSTHEACRLAAYLPDYGELARTQRLEWEQLWRRFAFDLTYVRDRSDAHIETVLRLHVFHLLQTTSLVTRDLDVGIPARGLHGEAYRGHIFWDELFVFPLFNLRVPEITRALLQYRYRRLAEARRAAREAGFRGAMFPWQSASNGREESQRLHLNPRSGRWIEDNTLLQRHVNAAIAFNLWNYFEVTDDTEFLGFYGAEMLLEIARFWASACAFNTQRRRYEIHGVVGPDEYHVAYPVSETPGINNNAYTNVMAVWVLRRALSLPDVLPGQRWEELIALLDIGRDELDLWHDIAERMFVPFQDGHIISQFEGYEDLEEFDWEGYRERHGDIRRLDRLLDAEGESPNRFKASKQADVLMLFYLFSSEELVELLHGLGYPFDPASIPANVRYYLDRTSDGSTLSQVVHSWVLARSDRDAAWRVFCDALDSDVADTQGGTTEEGIHVGAMAGTVDLMQRCFTGIETRGGVLRLNPCLPSPLKHLSLQLHFRGHTVHLEVASSSVEVRVGPAANGSLRLEVAGVVEEIEPGTARRFSLLSA